MTTYAGGTALTNTITGVTMPSAMTFDAGGTLYVANTSPANTVTTYAGGTLTGTIAGLNSPSGLTVDDNGTLYVADFGNTAIAEFRGGTRIATLSTEGMSPQAVALIAP